MAEIPNRSIFSQTDSANTGALPALTGATAPSQIDNSVRASMGAIAREYDWRTYAGTVGGSANAYTLTYSVAPAAYYTPMRFTFIANFAVTGSATLNVNSLGAKTIKKLVAGAKTNLASGDINSGDYVDVVYDGTDFVWTNRGGSAYSVNGLTEETAVDTADFVGGYDTSGTAERKFSVNNLHKAVNTFTAETAVAVDDVVGLYDTSAGTMDKATIQNVFKSINALTEDTSPDEAADFILTYDTSASDVKKVKPSNLASGAWTYLETLNPSSAANATNTVSFSGYNVIRITFYGVTPANSGVALKPQISTDGSSFSDWDAGSYFISTGGIPTPAGTISVNISDAVSNTATDGGVSGTMMLYNYNKSEIAYATYETILTSGGGVSALRGQSFESGTTARTHIRFLFSSGNIASGKFIIEALA